MELDKKIRKIGDTVWIVEGDIVRWFTFPFSTRMTIVRLKDGSLFIHSPIKLTKAGFKEVEQLGTVKYIVSPNKWHHLYMKLWQERYPQADLYYPPGLQSKRTDIDFKAGLDEFAAYDWNDEILQIAFEGSRMITEIVFFHKASKILILGDLIENFDPSRLNPIHRLVARFAKILAPNGETPLDLRKTFTNKEKARKSLSAILDWQPQKIILAHGILIESDAAGFLDRAFGWLKA